MNMQTIYGIVVVVTCLAVVQSAVVNNDILKEAQQILKRMAESRARSEIPPSERSEIVKHHNRLRRQEGSSNMEMLSWSAELAQKAQDLANTCIFDHAMMEWPGSTYPKVGQNLYISGDRDTGVAIDEWYNEIQYFRYGAPGGGCDAGQVCGHYTQVVWAKTTEVGCGIKLCKSAYAPMFGQTFYDSYMVVCNYGPAGNNLDENPYEKGSPCSQCSGEGLWCKNQLCSSGGCNGNDCSCAARCQNGGQLDSRTCTCTCAEGFLGPDCSDVCEDKDPTCGPMNGWPNSWCDDPARPYVTELCPLMCKKCTPRGGHICEDRNHYCNANPGWDASWCREDYVQYECPKMCGTC